MKVTTIEEAHDISNIMVDELVGSLQTFELAISDKSEKKNKTTTFVSNAEDEEIQADLDTDEGLSNTIVLLGNQFNRILKRMNRRGRPNVRNISSDIRSDDDFQNNTKPKEKTNLKQVHSML